MRVSLLVTTKEGQVYSGEFELTSDAEPAPRAGTKRRRGGTAGPSVDPKIDFSLPIRPFIKKHSRGLVGGPRRLTLLVARLSGGDESLQIPRAQLVKQWGKMTSLMGGSFNAAYDTRARDSGWISSPKAGVYMLMPSWKEIFL